jgi:hypothetical protein
MAVPAFVWEIGNFKCRFLKTHTCNKQSVNANGHRIGRSFGILQFFLNDRARVDMCNERSGYYVQKFRSLRPFFKIYHFSNRFELMNLQIRHYDR